MAGFCVKLCCEGGCLFSICVTGCDGEAVAPFSFTVERWDGSGWVLEASGTITAPCTSIFNSPRGGTGGTRYKVTVTPLPPLDLCFSGGSAEFDCVDGESHTVTVPLTLSGDCDCGCVYCPGVPAPPDTACFQVNGVTLANQSPGRWAACTSYTADAFKWCTRFADSCYQCYEWATSQSVPVIYELVWDCPDVTLNIYYPAAWNRYDANCSAYQAGLTYSAVSDCSSPMSGWSGTGCGAAAAGELNPDAVCYNHWRLASGLTCSQFLHCAGFSGGSALRPTCPPDPECGTPDPIRMVVGVTSVTFQPDCEASNPYEADVVLDLGARAGEACECDADATLGDTGFNETDSHPLASILGATPTISITLC